MCSDEFFLKHALDDLIFSLMYLAFRIPYFHRIRRPKDSRALVFCLQILTTVFLNPVRMVVHVSMELENTNVSAHQEEQATGVSQVNAL